MTLEQCDHIRIFIALWGTLQSLWEQLFSPKTTFLVNLCKGVKMIHFSIEIIFEQLL